MKKEHRFVLVVKNYSSRKAAKSAVLCAFACRNPDGAEFHLLNDKEFLRIKRLRAALDAATDIGIYPKEVVGGKKSYKKRTPYMEGWNDAQRESIRATIKSLKLGDWT